MITKDWYLSAQFLIPIVLLLSFYLDKKWQWETLCNDIYTF